MNPTDLPNKCAAVFHTHLGDIATALFVLKSNNFDAPIVFPGNTEGIVQDCLKILDYEVDVLFRHDLYNRFYNEQFMLENFGINSNVAAISYGPMATARRDRYLGGMRTTQRIEDFALCNGFWSPVPPRPRAFDASANPTYVIAPLSNWHDSLYQTNQYSERIIEGFAQNALLKGGRIIANVNNRGTIRDGERIRALSYYEGGIVELYHSLNSIENVRIVGARSGLIDLFALNGFSQVAIADASLRPTAIYLDKYNVSSRFANSANQTEWIEAFIAAIS